jgi:Ca2+-dependent lipid-binding protein
LQTVGFLESEKHKPGKAYHLIAPENEDSTLMVTMTTVEGLEGEPKLKLYVYIDENYVYKTKTFRPDNNPAVNLGIDM